MAVAGETIAAIATAPGRSGVAVIRVSGSEAFGIAERLTGMRDELSGMSVRKIYQPATRNPQPAPLIDECVILKFKSPHSYTGEDVVEFQCHGGAVVPRRVLDACLAAGARLARRGEFTQRAFLNGKLDYEQAEGVIDLIDARTDRAADSALSALVGDRREHGRELYETALALSAELEHSLDVEEGELPSGFLAGVGERLSRLRASVAAELKRSRAGRILRDGATVVLAGPPNAGKSSLFNALLEENRAIVSDVPGTTRDTIEAWLDLDGWPVRLVDTAGLRETGDGVEAEGVRRAETLIGSADVVVWLQGCKVAGLQGCKVAGLQGCRVTGLQGCKVAGLQGCKVAGLQGCKVAGLQGLFVHAKCDLRRGEGLNVSAKTGEGLEALRREIVARLEAKAESGGDFGDTGDADRREAVLVATLAKLQSADGLLDDSNGIVLLANLVRDVASQLGSLVGAVYSADLLDRLFSRFCVGK